MDREVDAGSRTLDERVHPQRPDEAGGARDVELVQRVTNRHEEVEPHLRTGCDEHGSPTASSPDDIRSITRDCVLVDGDERLRAPEHDSGVIRITEGGKPPGRLRSHDQLGGCRSTFEDRKATTCRWTCRSTQIPTAIPNEGATYGRQSERISPLSASSQTLDLGGTGRRCSTKLDSSRSRSSLAALHRRQAATTLSQA